MPKDIFDCVGCGNRSYYDKTMDKFTCPNCGMQYIYDHQLNKLLLKNTHTTAENDPSKTDKTQKGLNNNLLEFHQLRNEYKRLSLILEDELKRPKKIRDFAKIRELSEQKNIIWEKIKSLETGKKHDPNKKKNNIGVFIGLTIILVFCCFFYLLSQLINGDSGDSTTQTASETFKPSYTTTFTQTHTPTETSIPTSTKTPTPLSTIELISNGNIRKGPDISYEIEETKKNGDDLFAYAVDQTGEWILVDPVKQLWVHISIIKTGFDIGDLPVAPTYTPSPTPTLTDTPTQTKAPTKTPTLTPIPGLSIEQIYNNFNYMTAYQFKDYKTEIIGKPIRQEVKVNTVHENGAISLHGDWFESGIYIRDFAVVVTGVPKDIALKMYPGRKFYLEAYINGVVGNYNYFWNCENTLVLVYQRMDN